MVLLMFTKAKNSTRKIRHGRARAQLAIGFLKDVRASHSCQLARLTLRLAMVHGYFLLVLGCFFLFA